MRASIIALATLAACAAPDLNLPQDDGVAGAEWPRLVPLTDALGPATTPPSRIAPGTGAALEARAEGLRARAAALRQSALTDAERRRIREALLRLRASDP